MSFFKLVHCRVRRYLNILQQFADQYWYPPLIAFLAALDFFVIVIPTDGILISSSMLRPRRWFLFSMTMAVGSTLGALALAALVKFYGLPLILSIYPQIMSLKIWIITNEFFQEYGLWVTFFVSATPLMQHPAIILAVLANPDLLGLVGVFFCGRVVKFLLMSYVGSHAPRLLSKLWGIQDELHEVGVLADEEDA